MTTLYKLILVLLLLTSSSKSMAQASSHRNFNLRAGGRGDPSFYLTEKVSTPLHNNIAVFTKIVWILSGLTALISAFRLYANWQFGADDIIRQIGLWLGSCIVLIIAGLFLQFYVGSQDYTVNSLPTVGIDNSAIPGHLYSTPTPFVNQEPFFNPGSDYADIFPEDATASITP